MLLALPILAAATVIALLAIAAWELLQVGLQTVVRHRGPVRRVAVPLLLLGLLLPTVAQASPAPLPLRWRSSAAASGEGEISSGRASREGSSFGENRTSGFRLFLQVDPAGYQDSPNLYAGFGNDPVNNRDPTGMKMTPEQAERVRAEYRAQIAAARAYRAGTGHYPFEDLDRRTTVALGANLVKPVGIAIAFLNPAAVAVAPTVLVGTSNSEPEGAALLLLGMAAGEGLGAYRRAAAVRQSVIGSETAGGLSIVEGTTGGELSIASAQSKAAGSLPPVALGKGKTLLDFAQETGSSPYQMWHGEGLVDQPVGSCAFSESFGQATSRTPKIRFNLDGVDIQRALQMDASVAASRSPLTHAGIKAAGHVTEWELRQCLRSQDLLDKTTFHFGSNVEFTLQEAAQLGLTVKP